MKKIINSILFVGIAFCMASCQPEIPVPTKSENPITSVTAQILIDGEVQEFHGTPVEGSNVITIEFPWFYPEKSDNPVTFGMLENAKMSAQLANNVVITEPLLRMDLNQENKITVVDQAKKSHEYIIVGKIVKLKSCDILDFAIPTQGYAGVIREDENSISIIAIDDIAPDFASVTLSPHATISPDPSTTKIDYNTPVEFKVTAHNGVDHKVYTVIKQIPPKRSFGLREASAKILFEKRLKGDLEITVDDMTSGLAFSGNRLIINTAGEDATVIDYQTGDKVGTMSLGSVKGAATNNYMTSDDAGNILICNMTPADGNIFKIWKAADINSTPVEYISIDLSYTDGEGNTGCSTLGKKISVQGSLDGDAIITAPFYGPANTRFAQWTVKNGELQSQIPAYIDITGLSAGWTNDCDICYVEPTTSSDYFTVNYGTRTLSWINGETNAQTAALTPGSSNFIFNAVDVAKFNGGTYLTTSQVNLWTWGGADLVWLFDVSSTDKFSGGMDADYNAETQPRSGAIVWQSGYNLYGPRAIAGAPANSKALADVLLTVTPDGYYMYMYFMFSNGYVVGVQFDCLDI